MPERPRTSQERRAAAEARRARRGEVTDADVVMEAAGAFLAVRARSSAETARRLRQLGYPPALCDTVIERLTELGVLDDHAFARAWVESRDRSRPRGSSALRRELAQKGVAEATIRAVLAEREARAASPADERDGGADEGADRAAARRLLERARSLQREADPRRRRSRAYALLASKGFAPDVCEEVASAFAREGGMVDEPAV